MMKRAESGIGDEGGDDREERAKGESVTGVAVLMTELPSEGT